MQVDIYATYAEVNEALSLPRGTGTCGDLTPIPALDKDVHPEQFSCILVMRKWTYTFGDKAEPPDLSFIGLECVESLHDGYKTDIYIYARIDGHDSQN